VDETQHKVTLTKNFEIAATETTQAQFTSLMGYNPSYFSGCISCPVEQVTWHRAAAYCNALSKIANLTACYSCTGTKATVSCSVATAYANAKIYTCPGYRLPTEAEWEYAYRAGTTSALYNGVITSCSGSDSGLDKIGFYKSNSGNKTHPVAQKTANAWGISGMAGNVLEWCHDGYQANLGSLPSTDPWGAAIFTKRLIRGGGYVSDPTKARAAHRDYDLPTNTGTSNGFRCVRTLKP